MRKHLVLLLILWAALPFTSWGQSGLWNTFPRSSVFNMAHCCYRYIIQFSNLALGHSLRSKPSDIQNIVFSNFSSIMLFTARRQSHFYGMPLIFKSIAPFEIMGTIIVFDSIFMIYLYLFWVIRFFQEGRTHQPMNQKNTSLVSSFAKSDFAISTSTYSYIFRKIVFSCVGLWVKLYTAKITDGIKFFIACHITPFFIQKFVCGKLGIGHLTRSFIAMKLDGAVRVLQHSFGSLYFNTGMEYT